MEELVSYIVKALVNNPDHVTVQRIDTDEGARLTVSVMPEDAGMVIGKKGYVIRAIRQLANVLAGQQHKRVFVDVVPLAE